ADVEQAPALRHEAALDLLEPAREGALDQLAIGDVVVVAELLRRAVLEVLVRVQLLERGAGRARAHVDEAAVAAAHDAGPRAVQRPLRRRAALQAGHDLARGAGHRRRRRSRRVNIMVPIEITASTHHVSGRYRISMICRPGPTRTPRNRTFAG